MTLIGIGILQLDCTYIQKWPQINARIKLNSVPTVEHRAFLLSILQILPLILGEIVSSETYVEER